MSTTALAGEQHRDRGACAFALVLAGRVLRRAAGFCVGFGVAMWETMLQELVPENMLSRVVSHDFFEARSDSMPIGLGVSRPASRRSPRRRRSSRAARSSPRP
jgi:hypothetical protein